MKSYTFDQPDQITGANGANPLTSLLSSVLHRFTAIKDRQETRPTIRISKTQSDVHHVECFDTLTQDRVEDHIPAAAGLFGNGSNVDIFLHDQSIVSGDIIAQDDASYTVNVAEWTYFDDNVLATMTGVSTGKKVQKIMELGADISARYQSILADAKLVHFNRKGAIIGLALHLDLGERIQLACNDHRPICGVVKWQFLNLVGLEFLRPMTGLERSRWVR